MFVEALVLILSLKFGDLTFHQDGVDLPDLEPCPTYLYCPPVTFTDSAGRLLASSGSGPGSLVRNINFTTFCWSVRQLVLLTSHG